jgi:hypothetical protein
VDNKTTGARKPGTSQALKEGRSSTFALPLWWITLEGELPTEAHAVIEASKRE